MNGRRIAMAGGALWYLLRYVLISLLILRLVPGDPLFHLNLIWLGGPTLLLVATYARTMFGDVIDRYLPLQIIGSLLAALGDIAVAASSSYLTVAERTGAGDPELARLFFAIAYGVLIADLLILAALISYRAMRRREEADVQTQDDGPTYDSTRVENDS
jgi:hypothetical protein